MVNVADPMYVLAIAALKELIAQKVCTSGSVDFTKGEIVLLYQWRMILRRVRGAPFWVKTKETRKRKKTRQVKQKQKRPT